MADGLMTSVRGGQGRFDLGFVVGREASEVSLYWGGRWGREDDGGLGAGLAEERRVGLAGTVLWDTQHQLLRLMLLGLLVLDGVRHGRNSGVDVAGGCHGDGADCR